MPKEDLKPYAGRWVALRDGHVVATDLSATALRENPDVRSSDALLRVPRSTHGLFVL